MSVFGTVKIVLLGDSATGKTTLKRSFMGLHLEEVYMSTLGVDLASHKHVDEDIEITFQIWDLGGQTEYKKLRKKQYVGSEGGLLVFDKSRPETFASLSNWLNEVNSSLKNRIPVYILGNKDDLMEEQQNMLLDTQARSFLNENKGRYEYLDLIDYYSTCALTGSNVNDAFLDLGRIIMRKKSDAMKI
ncbi:GTP-binding protein [Candidatus Heimdallarchaeota archaeon]|nr:MAG: GTP-binding protein [Candidatus Heimdallarchaeota archaeon]